MSISSVNGVGYMRTIESEKKKYIYISTATSESEILIE